MYRFITPGIFQVDLMQIVVFGSEEVMPPEPEAQRKT
jgi:hypothetical protein